MKDFVRFHESSSVTKCDRMKVLKQMLFQRNLPEKCTSDMSVRGSPSTLAASAAVFCTQPHVILLKCGEI